MFGQWGVGIRYKAGMVGGGVEWRREVKEWSGEEQRGGCGGGGGSDDGGGGGGDDSSGSGSGSGSGRKTVVARGGGEEGDGGMETVRDCGRRQLVLARSPPPSSLSLSLSRGGGLRVEMLIRT